MSGRWDLYVRDTGLIRQGQIDTFTKLVVTERWADVSTWELTFPYTAGWTAAIDEGLVLHRDGGMFMSGPLTNVHLQHGVEDAQDAVVLTGVDDTVRIRDRQAHPAPLSALSPTGTYPTATDDAAGPYETVLKRYVDRNLGPSAVGARRHPALRIELDAGRGGAVAAQARFDEGDLLAFLQKQAAAGGELGYRIIEREDELVPYLLFEVLDSRDRSGAGVFDVDLGNVRSLDAAIGRAAATHLYAGGVGDEAARVFAEAEDADALASWGRIEGFVNQSGAVLADLAAPLAQGLRDQGSVFSFSFVPAPGASMRWPDDWRCGDLVSVRLAGTIHTMVVRSVEISVDGAEGGGAETVTPTVATPSAPSVLRLFDDLRRIDSRVRSLERY